MTRNGRGLGGGGQFLIDPGVNYLIVSGPKGVNSVIAGTSGLLLLTNSEQT